jgi:hypothetical protein
VHDRYCVGNILDRVSTDLYGYRLSRCGYDHPKRRSQSVREYIDTADIAHSFLLSNGVFTSFDPPGTGPNGSDAAGINPGGVIVGLFADALGAVHGFIRTP